MTTGFRFQSIQLRKFFKPLLGLLHYQATHLIPFKFELRCFISYLIFLSEI